MTDKPNPPDTDTKKLKLDEENVKELWSKTYNTEGSPTEIILRIIHSTLSCGICLIF